MIEAFNSYYNMFEMWEYKDLYDYMHHNNVIHRRLPNDLMMYTRSIILPTILTVATFRSSKRLGYVQAFFGALVVISALVLADNALSAMTTFIWLTVSTVFAIYVYGKHKNQLSWLVLGFPLFHMSAMYTFMIGLPMLFSYIAAMWACAGYFERRKNKLRAKMAAQASQAS